MTLNSRFIFLTPPQHLHTAIPNLLLISLLQMATEPHGKLSILEIRNPQQPEGHALPRIIAGNYRDCCQNRSN